MLNRIIEWAVRNTLLVLLLTVAAIAGGIWAIRATPLEALPDLSDVQVIVQADYSEQAP
jgi:copper/silver efflux system protein